MFKFFRKYKLFFNILIIIFLVFWGIVNIFFDDTPDEAKRKMNLVTGIGALLMAFIKIVDLIGWFLNKRKEKKAE